MKAKASHFKLGLFALGAIAAAVVTLLAFGLRKAPTDTYHTYFDESVQGLERGALVKYRGVRIGSVESIGIAPDHRHVEVELAIDRQRARAIELAKVAPQLRAQLALIGITGLRVIDLEIVDPQKNPAPVLTFRPPERYIPSRPSLFGGLERAIASTTDRLPALVEHSIALLAKLEGILEHVQHENIPQRIANVVDTVGGAIAEMRRLMTGFDRAKIPNKLANAIERFDVTAAKLDTLLDQVGGQDGLVASARRVTESVDELGRSTLESTSELDQTLRDLSDAARSVRRFMEDLDREPDMLVKGRARTRR